LVICKWLCGVINAFAFETVLIPFTSNTDYDKGDKSKGLSAGFYTKFYHDSNALEFEYEKSVIEFSSPSILYKQDNIITSYSSLLNEHYKMRGTLHYISSTYKQSDNSLTALLGLKYFQQNEINFGANVSLSSYPNSLIATSTIQLQPYFGFQLGNYNSKFGLLYIKLNYYIIHPRSTTSVVKYSYESYEISIKQNIGSFTNYISGWTGKQLYPVRENGFSIYNFNEIHNGGFSLYSQYKLDKNVGIKLSYIYEDFTESSTLNNTVMNKYILSADFNF
jgi:hypothetical protein